MADQSSTPLLRSRPSTAVPGSIPPQQTSGSHDHLTDRIDLTLDLIAAAQGAARGRANSDQYAISVIVPVYNEVRTLPQVLARIQQVMPREIEVIVVDDGSTDGTQQWLREVPTRPNLKIIHRRVNRGKGSAVRLGIRHSRGDVVAIQDADLEYDPADLLRVIWPILDGDADVVYGSRYLEQSGDRSLLHRLGNGLLTWASNRVTGLRLTDMETCYKAFDGELIRSIELRECRFGFEPEITAKIARRDARILEVPIGYTARGKAAGKKIGWRDGLEAFACICKYRRG